MSEIVRNVTILRRQQVQARTGLSRSTIYKRMSEGTFPKPYSLGGGARVRAVGWRSSDIDDWLECLSKVNNFEQEAPLLGELRESRKESVPGTPTKKPKPKGVAVTPITEVDQSDDGEGDFDDKLKVTPETPAVTCGDVERPDAGANRTGVPSSDGGLQVLPRPSPPPRIQWPRRNR